MATNTLDRGTIETNIARSWPLELSGFAGGDLETRVESGALTARTLLGTFSTTHRLGLIDLKVLAFAIERWRQQGGQTASDPASFTLYQLGQTIYGREPDGEERRLIRESIERLFRVEINATGHVGRGEGKVRKMARDGRVFAQKDTIWDDLEGSEEISSARQVGGRRATNYRIWLGAWLVEQIRAGHVTYLTFATMRDLSGLALRLWVFLEGEPFIDVGTGPQLAQAHPISDELLAVLGVGHGRAADARRAIKRAAERICDHDQRYAHINLRKDGQQWLLDARRATSSPRSLVPQLALDVKAPEAAAA